MWRFLGYYIFVAMGGFIFRVARKAPEEPEQPGELSGLDALPLVNPSPEPEFADTEE